MRKLQLIQLVGIIILAVLLSGCKYSDRYMLKHPATLQSVLVACNAKDPEVASSDQQCQSAGKLYSQLVPFSRQLAKQPEAFGNTVLRDQMKLGRLQSQIDMLSDQKLTEKQSSQLSTLRNNYKALKYQIELKIGVIAQMEGI